MTLAIQPASLLRDLPTASGLHSARASLPTVTRLGLAAVVICLLSCVFPATAQPDYPPALWNQAYPGHWYTTGYSHSFAIIHDMEGYYLPVISYFQQSSTSASIHYCVNSLQNGSDSQGHAENNPYDAPAGQITQMVREQYWAWHVICWNRYSLGTEHEGFVSSPVWYSEDMYQASAALQRHLCVTWNIPMDRNHIIGHNEWQNPLWTAWMATNWPAIDTTCNNHTDPGQYWDWAHFMTLITNMAPIILAQPQSQTVNATSNATFSVGPFGAVPFAFQWRFNGTNIPGATASDYTRTNVQFAQGGNYSVIVTNSLGSITSSNALLTVLAAPVVATQPQNLVLVAGQNGLLTVSAYGTPPLTYQWQFQGVTLDGATDSVCTLTSVQSGNAGAYTAVVTNDYGSVTSSPAFLTLLSLGAWGDNAWGQVNVPMSTTNDIALAAGGYHTLALRADGVVTAWGDNWDGQCDVPPMLTNALAIAAAGYHSLALSGDGTVVGWGGNDYGQIDVPPGLGPVIGLAAGTWHSLALRADRTVVAWGDNSLGQTNVPAGLSNVVALAAGGGHNLALRADGTIVAWGDNTDALGNFAGESVVPPGLSGVVGIAAGDYHSLAVKADGTVVAWGDDSLGQCDPPPDLAGVVAVAGGSGHSLALKTNGAVAAWGNNANGECNLPPELTNVMGVAACEAQSLVLVPGNLPPPRLLNPARTSSQFSLLLQTFDRKNYALEYKSSLGQTNWSPLATNRGNGTLEVFTDPAATATQRFYRVRQW